MADIVISRKVWMKISVVMYIFFHTSVSLFKWCWQAIIIRRRSYVVKTNCGKESESEGKFSE